MIELTVLNDVIGKAKLVTIFLMNGFQLKGIIVSSDDKVIMLESVDGRRLMVYKHAISTLEIK